MLGISSLCFFIELQYNALFRHMCRFVFVQFMKIVDVGLVLANIYRRLVVQLWFGWFCWTNFIF